MNRLFVANSAENTISAISTDDLLEDRRLHILNGEEPRKLLVQDQFLYCVCSSSGNVACIGLEQDSQRSVCVGAYPVDCCALDGSLFFACAEAESIWKIQLRSLEQKCCARTGAFPCSLVTQLKEQAIYCFNLLSSDVIRYDSNLQRIARFRIEGLPLCACAFKDDILFCMIDEQNMSKLMKLSNTGHITELLTLDMPCGNITILEGDNQAVLTHFWHDKVSMIDLQSNQMLFESPTSRMPGDIAIDENARRIYTSCLRDNCVDYFDYELCLMGKIAVGKEPRGLALFNGNE